MPLGALQSCRLFRPWCLQGLLLLLLKGCCSCLGKRRLCCELKLVLACVIQECGHDTEGKHTTIASGDAQTSVKFTSSPRCLMLIMRVAAWHSMKNLPRVKSGSDSHMRDEVNLMLHHMM